MARIAAITGCTTGVAHTRLAAEALKKTAALMGHDIAVESQGAAGVRDPLTERDIAEADVVLVASDIQVDMRRFEGKVVHAVPVSDAIRKTRAVIEAAVAEVAVDAEDLTSAAPARTASPVVGGRFVVAVTSCPTGIAHTFMAAAALKKSAEAMGVDIKVETQGSVGAQNALTAAEIERADAVVIAADTFVDVSRFAGKRLLQTSTKAALHDGAQLIGQALALEQPVPASSARPAAAPRKAGSGPYKHLMTGVSYMLPLVVAGGLCIALSFAIGGIHAGDKEGTLGWALMQIGGGTAFKLYIPVLAAYIASSIADRPGLTSGLIGGMLAATLGAGFLGGIAAGFLAGYCTLWLNTRIQLPDQLAGLKPVLILPLLSTLVVGLTMIFVLGPPVKAVLDALTSWLGGMQTSSAVILGLILGAMMGCDMGGPVNKSAYTFAVGLLASNVYGPMAAVMAAGMVPPLGLALAASLFPDRFTEEEREARRVAAVLGLSFITEGAIPYAAADPLRVIPCISAGAAVTGALSLAGHVQLMVPHGGVFVLLIPNAVQHLGIYVVAMVVGTLVTAGALYFAKRPLPNALASSSTLAQVGAAS